MSWPLNGRTGPKPPPQPPARAGPKNRLAPSMLASYPSQQVESDSRPFGNPRDSVKPDRALGLPSPGLGESVEGDRQHDDDADDDLLDVGRDFQQDEAVEQHADEDRADHGAEDRADAAEQAGAADHHRGDHGELVAGAGDGFG